MTLYTVPGTGYAQLLINAGDGPTMIINRDELNALYVGDDNSVASKNGTGDIDVIDPLSFITYDGVSAKYGICAVANASIQVDCVKGATQWQPSPAAAAFQIGLLGLATANNQGTQIDQVGGGLPSALVGITGSTIGKEVASWIAEGAVSGVPGGTPLLQGWNSVAQTNVTVPANGNVSEFYAFDEPGYFIGIWADFPGASGAVPFFDAELRWYDSVSNVTLAQEDWTMPVATTGSFSPVYGRGPVKAPVLEITFFNFSNQPIQVFYEIAQTTHHINRDDWRSGSPPFPIPGYTTVPGADPTENVLAAMNAFGLAGSSGPTFLLPLYAGAAWVAAYAASANVNMLISAVNPPSGSLYQVFPLPLSTANIDAQLIMMPRSPCIVQFENNNAGVVDVWLSVIAQEYAS